MTRIATLGNDVQSRSTEARRPHVRDRREQIVRAAHELSLEKGFTHITVSDIASRAGMTRSLFYHYFRSKDDVSAAVLDDISDTIIGELRSWNESRIPGNVDKSLDDLIALMRVIINDEGPFSRKLVQAGNGGLYIQFVDRLSERVADYISGTTVKDFERIHGRPGISHIKESLMTLIAGAIALLRENPGTDDRTIKDIFVQTLHLEAYVQPFAPPSDRPVPEEGTQKEHPKEKQGK
ncbi:TetR/AcrR family transcriptional regulator [Bifidobacterium xylocopae]|uniref:AcrR family transcriptional regulator n=1 Tax=Bifidobacterium xylocopae TaxID=2493119 RepID=A0A366KEH4_9BIFI|nr:TetR/AcrR family transcriptional regulator [Bifidobacterium xylocopae]RBQ00095.1 AcrR family transcriptional regulator [Bifidobacterium xylocopae]